MIYLYRHPMLRSYIALNDADDGKLYWSACRDTIDCIVASSTSTIHVRIISDGDSFLMMVIHF